MAAVARSREPVAGSEDEAGPRTAVTCTLSTARILRIGALTVAVDRPGHVIVGNRTARVELTPLGNGLVSCIAESAGPAVCAVESAILNPQPAMESCPTPHAI